MKPKPSSATTQPDFFQTELRLIINLNHPLVKLAEEFNWDAFEQQLHPPSAREWIPHPPETELGKIFRVCSSKLRDALGKETQGRSHVI